MGGYYKHFTFDFHEWYTQVTGKFSVEYIPDDIWFSKIDPFYNDQRAAKFLDNKCLYDKYFKGVKFPKMIAKRISGVWFDRDDRLLADMQSVVDIIKDYDSILVKAATNSFGGHDVLFLERSDLKNHFGSVVEKIDGDIVVQERIEQHDELSKLNSSSVNTCRVLSLLRDGKVKVYSSIIRMGVGDSKVDNASSGGITCGIDQSGRLKTVAFSQKGERFDRHPTTNICFENIIVPGYSEIIKLTKILHVQMPLFKLISWDWAVDNEGTPILIEANFSLGELDFHQMNNGPVFGNDTKMILDEVFHKG